MLTNLPFLNFGALLSLAESAWWTLEPGDWLEAFSAHPRIGEKKLFDWCSQEQRGIDSATRQTLVELAKGNEEYYRRFGWIFLINATGKTADEMLGSLKARLRNEADEEFRIAAGEQAQITKLRLEKLFDS